MSQPYSKEILERQIHAYHLYLIISKALPEETDPALIKDAQELATAILSELSNEYQANHGKEELEKLLERFNNRLARAI